MTLSEDAGEQNQFKRIISEIFQDKFHSGLRNGSVLSVLQELMEFAQGIVDNLERDNKSPHVACQNGCDYCCYSHLKIIPAEALLIYSFIDTHFGDAERSGLKQKTDRNLRLTNRKTIEERFHLKEKTPCVFLEKGSCRIYPVRPFICRAWNSLDKAVCKSAFYADTYHAEIETSPARNFVFRLTRTMFIDFSRQVNFQSGRLEMSQAVSKCMSLNGPTALWLTGHSIFD